MQTCEQRVGELLRRYGFSGKIVGKLVQALKDLGPSLLEERLRDRCPDTEENARRSKRFLNLKGFYKNRPHLFVLGIVWQLSQTDEDIQADADAQLEYEMREEEARLR